MSTQSCLNHQIYHIELIVERKVLKTTNEKLEMNKNRDKKENYHYYRNNNDNYASL